MLLIIFSFVLSNINIPLWNYSINIHTPIKNKPLLSDDGLNMYISNDRIYKFRNHDGYSTKLECIWNYNLNNSLPGYPVLNDYDKKMYLINSNNYLIIYDLFLGCNNNSTVIKKKLNFLESKLSTNPIINKKKSILYFVTSYPESSLYSVTINGNLIWKYHLDDSILSSPILSEDGNTIYFSSQDNKIYSINTITNIPNWIYKTNNFISTSPIINNDTIVVVSKDNNAYFIDNDTGELKYKITVGNSKAVIFNNTKIFISIDGIIRCYDEYIGKNILIWEYNINDEIRSSPVLGNNNNIIYIVSVHGLVIALDIISGNPLWYYKLEGYFITDLVLSPQCNNYRCIQTLFITETFGNIYAFNTTFDRPEWIIEDISYIYTDSNITNNLIIENSENIYLYDILENDIIWEIYNDYSIIRVIEDSIYLLKNNDLYVMDKLSGKIESSYNLKCYYSTLLIDSIIVNNTLIYQCINDTYIDIKVLNMLINKTNNIYSKKLNNNGNSIIFLLGNTPNKKYFLIKEVISNYNTGENYYILRVFDILKAKIIQNITLENDILLLDISNETIIYIYNDMQSNILINKLNLFNKTRGLIYSFINYGYQIKYYKNYIVLLNSYNLTIINLDNNLFINKNMINYLDFKIKNDNIYLLTHNYSNYIINILNYTGHSISNISFDIYNKNKNNSFIISDFIFNNDNSIMYIYDGNYLYGINKKSEIIWKYPNKGLCKRIILSLDEKKIILENNYNKSYNSISNLKSIIIPFM